LGDDLAPTLQGEKEDCSSVDEYEDSSFFSESKNEDWRHVLSCPGIGAKMKTNESWDSLKATQAHFNIPSDIWNTIEHKFQYFNNRQERKDMLALCRVFK
jgi:hypothetical protein